MTNNILKILKDQGRTQAWLARQINRTYVTVTNYCNNVRQPSLEKLEEIALVLDVDIRDLICSNQKGSNYFYGMEHKAHEMLEFAKNNEGYAQQTIVISGAEGGRVVYNIHAELD